MLEKINAWIWGPPLLVLMLGVGIYLTIKTKFVQLRLLGPALRGMWQELKKPGKEGETSPFRALCTALAATVGTGNIVGVAGAIAIGGPGAVFWMWISGFLGMASKYAEAVLAIRYSSRNQKGERVGGPMYIIQNGLSGRFLPLARLYSFFGVIAALGVGNATQINAVIGAVSTTAESRGMEFGTGLALGIGLMMAVLVWAMVSGGASKIGSAAELLVPVASAVYILLCFGVLVMRMDGLGDALGQILEGALCPRAVTGGAVGSMMTSLRLGVSRGVFSNEAGMGTAAIAHGGANTDDPTKQGMMGILEVFIDTIVMCTMTALVILVSGVPVPYGTDAGSELTAQALSACYGSWVTVALSICLCCFALATVLGWGLYAGRCIEYLFGGIHWKAFATAQACAVVLGAVLETGLVWSFAEAVNGLMAIPNLIALMLLSKEVVRLTGKSKVCYNAAAKNFT